MVFASPAMFKSNGKICCFPEPERYFYSVIRKHNKFENAALSYDEFCSAFAEGETGDYQLGRTGYNVSGNIFFGMTGYIDYRFPMMFTAVSWSNMCLLTLLIAESGGKPVWVWGLCYFLNF